jgi:TolA-binding protein
MDPLQWLWIAGAALAGAAVGVAVCHWQMSRTIEALRQRIERAEQARNGAIERSAQAREQIAQLNQAIAAMRRTHSARAATNVATANSEERRERAEKALADAHSDDTTPAPARRELPQAFRDTEVLEGKR